MPTVRDNILAKALQLLQAATPTASWEMEPAGDPDTFPAGALFDLGHRVVEREYGATRYEMHLAVEGYVDGLDGTAPTAARSAMQAAVVAAMLGLTAQLPGVVEIVEDGELRMMTAELAARRRLGFVQDFAVQFLTNRSNPALSA